MNRYRAPQTCIDKADSALQIVSTYLPSYIDGRMRALNNLAYGYYLQADGDRALQIIDNVETLAKMRSDNAEVEEDLARLLRVRLLQRRGQIAEAYRELYDLGQTKSLRAPGGNLLHNYALSEYYITLLTLNFHYRDGQQGNAMQLIDEVEDKRASLKVDYAQDMALNYALAYGFYSIGETSRALDYCDANMTILSYGEGAYCPYQHANTLQMMAHCLRMQPGEVQPDSVLQLYDNSRQLFYHCNDPYQMLGGTNSTANYAMMIGDTATAWQVLQEWLTETDQLPTFEAPKMEAALFDLLLRCRINSNDPRLRQWYTRREQLVDFISQNAQEDFVLQHSLDIANRRSHWQSIVVQVFVVMTIVLAVLIVLLWRTTLRLRRDKRSLEQANRREVERIANVETCLSVIRHDVGPFIGYLNQPSLTDEMRNEVAGQLQRTFDNLKRWTRLSLPEGLTFQPSTFALQEVFDDVSHQTVLPKPEVKVIYRPTHLRMWGDRMLIVILLRNVVNNALQHTDHGMVEVSAEAQGQMVVISVADTGSGMEETQRTRLFKADRVGDDGHGFGLILCRHIVKKHDDNTRRGCRIEVQSQPKQGTVVKITLAQP